MKDVQAPAMLCDMGTLVRHPRAVAVVAWLAMLVETPTLLWLRDVGPPTGWATAAVVACALYTVGLGWYLHRKPLSAGSQADSLALFTFAVAVTPWLAATALLFLGAAAWSIWAAFFVSSALLAWWVSAAPPP